jgi:hypothetical protein
MSPITSLRLLVADLRHAELCLLGCKLVVRQSHVRAYPKHLVVFLVVILHSSITNSSHCCYHRRTVDSIAIVPPRGFVQRSSF